MSERRLRVPKGPRLHRGREPLDVCVATNLSLGEVAELDRIAGKSGECRSEFIRAAVRARIEASRESP